MEDSEESEGEVDFGNEEIFNVDFNNEEYTS